MRISFATVFSAPHISVVNPLELLEFLGSAVLELGLAFK